VLALAVAGCSRRPDAPPGAVVIAHFGDSTCSTDYLPPSSHVDQVLNARLAEHYRGQPVVNVNVCKSGDYVFRFMHERRLWLLWRTRYERDVCRSVPRIDIALVRYGDNYRKEVSLDAFESELEELCDRLLHDYPGIRIVLETNAYVDPAHNAGGRPNEEYDRVYEIVRRVARARRYPLVDVFARFRREVSAGNWDLCIRNAKLSHERFGRQIVDDSEDAAMAAVPHWFRNRHPNVRAAALTADEELNTLVATWPDRLPTAREDPSRSGPRAHPGATAVPPRRPACG